MFSFVTGISSESGKLFVQVFILQNLSIIGCVDGVVRLMYVSFVYVFVLQKIL